MHGERDEVIAYHHANQLHAACKGRPLMLVGNKFMTHNNYNFSQDVLAPLSKFFFVAGVSVGLPENYPLMMFVNDISKPFSPDEDCEEF